MTDAERKIDAFRLLYGAITLPFGGVLGALLANVGVRATAGVADVTIAQAFMLGPCLIAVFAFFLLVPMTCEGVIRRRLPPGRWAIPAATMAILLCAAIMPSEELGIPHRLWIAVITAWLICCAGLCWLCTSADIRKSIFR